MINQVVSNIVPKSAFTNFKQPQNGWYLNTNNEEEHKKAKHKWGIAIATSALVIGFGTLALMKGVIPKNAVKYLEKLKVNLEEKAKSGSRLANFYRKSADAVTSFMSKTQSINNITSLKDILFQKIMFATPFTKKIHTGITKFFHKISRKTVNSSYEKTYKKAAGLNEYMLELNQKFLQGTSKQNAAESLKTKINKANEELNKGFGIQARSDRLARTENATQNLFDDMWNASYSDIKNFRSKNMYQSFIAEEKMLPFKDAIAKEVSLSKKTLMDEYAEILAEYKKVLPEAEYKQLENKVKLFQKSLNKSIKEETVNYVDKARDLKLGSAPTDILSILGAVGAVGWYLGKSHDKDERISASLKYGIPAIGAITTSLLCTAKLISGAKSMAIGLASGWLMSKLGTFADDVRKQYELDISLSRRTLVKPQSDKV